MSAAVTAPKEIKACPACCAIDTLEWVPDEGYWRCFNCTRHVDSVLVYVPLKSESATLSRVRALEAVLGKIAQWIQKDQSQWLHDGVGDDPEEHADDCLFCRWGMLLDEVRTVLTSSTQ